MTSPGPDLDATPAERAQRSALASYVVGYFDAPYFPGMGAPPVPDPHIDTLVPATAPAASAALNVQVNGLGFEATSVVEVDGTAVPTTFVSATALTARYTPPTAAGTHQFSVRNVNGFESNDVPFAVTAPAVPAINATQPLDAVAGTATDLLVIVGTGFIASSVVDADGVAVPTTFRSAIRLDTDYTPPAVAGEVQLRVRNVATGTQSANHAFTITDTTAAADTMPAADGGTKKGRPLGGRGAK